MEQHFVIFVRTFIAFVFLAAAIPKLVNRSEFVEVIRNYRLLPESKVGFLSLLLPVIEAIVAIGLLTGIFMTWLAATAFGLFLLFGGAVAINLLRGRRDISCGCFGPRRNHRLTWGLVGRNAVLAGLAAVIWVASPGVDEAQQPPFGETLAAMFVAVAAISSWWLYGVTSEMWSLPSDDEGLSHNSGLPGTRRLFSLVKAGRRR